jgi:2-polyprenyl-3-methyl-5-hydroxy-6-metoxy-1,4-benzoquinol methylase
VVGVAEQGEGEAELFGEVFVLRLRVETDADDLRVLRRVFGLEVPEPGTLARSAGCVGLRIEPENDFLSAKVAKTDGVSVVVHRLEVRSHFARLEHARVSSGHCSDDAANRHTAILCGMRLDEWNERYRSRDVLDLTPARLLVATVTALPPGRALDLACGAGRNALWLAHHGWNVTAIDGAAEAIRIVEEHDARVDTRVLDLENDAPLPFEDETFDLVVILYFLYRPLFAEALRVLRPGGIVVTAIRTRSIKQRFCLSLEELREEFTGCEVLHASDGDTAELVARKRGTR